MACSLDCSFQYLISGLVAYGKNNVRRRREGPGRYSAGGNDENAKCCSRYRVNHPSFEVYVLCLVVYRRCLQNPTVHACMGSLTPSGFNGMCNCRACLTQDLSLDNLHCCILGHPRASWGKCNRKDERHMWQPTSIYPCTSSSLESTYALLLCLGANEKPGGAGPRSISEIRTQSCALELAMSVSRSFRPT